VKSKWPSWNALEANGTQWNEFEQKARQAENRRGGRILLDWQGSAG